MTVLARMLAMGLAVAVWATAAAGQGVQARLSPEDSRLSGTANGAELVLSLSQPVPYRVRLLPAPPRVVVEMNTLDWAGLDWAAGTAGVRAVRTGHRGDGWARMVLDLAFPMLPARSAQVVDPESGRATITLTLARAGVDAFERRATDEREFAARFSDHLLHPAPARPPEAPAQDDLHVILDPGHGGVDLGAVRDGVTEAEIALAYARQLRDALMRRGGFKVSMTRDADVFVSLDGRLRAARDAGAELFLSLHADALSEGIASGAAVYLLAEDASSQSAARLAERHDRADLLAGVDLSRNTDEIASVLMSVAWQDTAPRNDALANALIEGIDAAGLDLHARPLQRAAFSVLRAPDIPSALLELGFMSSPRDMARLRDPDWRARMAAAVADALVDWRARDAALRARMGR